MTRDEAIAQSWVIIREWQKGATSAEQLVRLIQNELLNGAIPLGSVVVRREDLREAMDCMAGHMIGINCHGPILDVAVAERLKGVLAKALEEQG